MGVQIQGAQTRHTAVNFRLNQPLLTQGCLTLLIQIKFFLKKRALFNEASDRPNSNSRHNMKFEFVPATTSCEMITVDEANDEIT